MDALLMVQDLVVRRGGKLALELDHLSIESGEALALIGPNGAGKSTFLLAISQLIKSERGKFIFQGEMLQPRGTHAYRQRIALVLQEPLLLDASVYENVAIGLKFRHIPNDEIRCKVQPWLEKLDISHLSSRSAQQLSGGEAQRVCLARALVLEPDLLLLDEPFSALDAPTRSRLLDDFQAILHETHITTLFVTHDLNEALLLGERVAVFLDGKLQQLDTPQVVFNAPANPDVAAFVGVETLIPGVVASSNGGLLSVKVDGYQLEAVGAVAENRHVFLMIRPENITLWRGSVSSVSSARNTLSGQIEQLTPQGPLVRVRVNCGFPLVALITRSSMEEMPLEIGHRVKVSFKASAVHVIPR